MSTPDHADARSPHRAVSAALGVPVRLAAATAPLPPEALTPGELARLEAMPTEARRRDWLLGRAALKALLGAGADTSVLAFPDRRLSLAHAGGRAFAALAGGDTVVGTGIDFEPSRAAVDPRTARFFLSPAERAAVGTAGDLLRLWTVKEALFKATADNGGLVLADYGLVDPTAPHGTCTGPRAEHLRYATVPVAGGTLTVAVGVAAGRHRAAV